MEASYLTRTFYPSKEGGLRVSTQKHCQCFPWFLLLLLFPSLFSHNLKPAIKRAKREKKLMRAEFILITSVSETSHLKIHNCQKASCCQRENVISTTSFWLMVSVLGEWIFYSVTVVRLVHSTRWKLCGVCGWENSTDVAKDKCSCSITKSWYF